MGTLKQWLITKQSFFKQLISRNLLLGVSLFNYIFYDFFAFDYYVIRHFSKHIHAYTLATLIYSHHLHKESI